MRFKLILFTRSNFRTAQERRGKKNKNRTEQKKCSAGSILNISTLRDFVPQDVGRLDDSN